MISEQILRRPVLLTEKSSRLREQNKFIFEVARKANKIQIRNAVQSMFKVSVVDVNTLVARGKERRMGRGVSRLQNWKKAIVTLKAGDTIVFFDENEEPSAQPPGLPVIRIIVLLYRAKRSQSCR